MQIKGFKLYHVDHGNIIKIRSSLALPLPLVPSLDPKSMIFS